MISTVIAKPTKLCSADCTYCSAPPDGEPKWSLDDFKYLFDRLAPHLTPEAFIIWHGGEPMLMGPDFYWKAWEYARSVSPRIRFSMQTNLLAYDSARWRDVFDEVMGGSLSTSYDPDERFRLYKGSAELYSRIFFSRLESVAEDGFKPLVIGTYTEETAHLAERMYDIARSYGDRAFSIRVNYRYPAGRDRGHGEMISPDTYGRILIRLYDRWIEELPGFSITPLDQMFLKVVGGETHRCPWTHSCGGHFMGLEPNGDVYNCSEFADLGEPEYRFGNLREHTVPQMMASRAAVQIRRRRIDLPMDCTRCRHFRDCEGGCARDSVLYHHGMGGKFHYCESWKIVFDRIKESLESGEADDLLRSFGLYTRYVRGGDTSRIFRRTAPAAA